MAQQSEHQRITELEGFVRKWEPVIEQIAQTPALSPPSFGAYAPVLPIASGFEVLSPFFLAALAVTNIIYKPSGHHRGFNFSGKGKVKLNKDGTVVITVTETPPAEPGPPLVPEPNNLTIHHPPPAGAVDQSHHLPKDSQILKFPNGDIMVLVVG